MIKRILIPLDPSPYTDAALEFGFAVAKRNGAEVTGLVVLDIPGIAKFIGPVPLGGARYAGELRESARKQAQEQIAALLDKFRAKCDQAGVPYHVAERQGSPSKRIVYDAMFHDLTVLGLRTHYHFPATDRSGDTLEEVLDNLVAPVYAIPDHYEPNNGKRVLVPFDGSLLAARALHQFARLELPSTVASITLLMCGDDREQADYCLCGAEAYLRAHGYEAITKVWHDADVIETVDARYLDDADVVVLGAHAKRQLVDFIVGSLARHLIRKAVKPLLIG